MDIATAPTTNIRVLAGVGLAVVYVLVNIVGGVVFAPARVIPLEVNILLGTFILVQEGIDASVWAYKRKTFEPEKFAAARESVDPSPPAPAAVIAHGLAQSREISAGRRGETWRERVALDRARTSPDFAEIPHDSERGDGL